MDLNEKRLPSSKSSRIERRMLKANPNKDDGSSLIELVQRRQLLKMAEEEERMKQTRSLPEDCFSCVLYLLPIDSLLRASCVCKLWNNIVKTPSFIQSHLYRSEPILLFITSTTTIEQFRANPKPPLSLPMKKPDTFIVEAHSQEEEAWNLFKLQQPFITRPEKYLHFLDITNGGMSCSMRSFNIGCSGRVFGSCNGLILLENKLKEGGLIIMNPATRKLTTLPVGTIVPYHKESYGFTFNNLRKEHKVVHMFRDGSFVSCEILTVEKRKWKMVDGPSPALFTFFGCNPLVAMGALHWVPLMAHTNSFLSMDLEEEKFKDMLLPKSKGTHDRVIEMCDLLCFVSHEVNQMDIWVMESLSENRWTKHHSITSSLSELMIPVIGSRSGSYIIFRREEVNHNEVEDEEIVIEGDEGEGNSGGESNEESSQFYVYNFSHQSMRGVTMEKGLPPLPKSFMPHVNSLVWC